MSDKMRDDFEKAYAELQLSLGLASPIGGLFECESGEYARNHTAVAWWAWQASRAAIEVELPGHDCDPGWNAAVRDCRIAIESLGIKVKPSEN